MDMVVILVMFFQKNDFHVFFSSMYGHVVILVMLFALKNFGSFQVG